MRDIVLDIDVALHYHIVLQSKFTVVSGDSANGKSALIKQLTEVPEWKKKYPNIIIPREVDTDTVADILRKVNENTVLLLDEDILKTLRRLRQAAKLNSLCCHILLMSHNSMFDLMYSYEDVYYLKQSGNDLTTEKMFASYTVIKD
ncbi:MAG: hypothetical protein NC548_45425, partial [Lachnospiraceae bacterium]|nr:hypothetical protein [Lachnospiraceae bacterium]